MFHKIKTIEPNAQNHSIKITYHDNVVITANFDVEKGVMSLLKNPEMFNQVEIGNNQRSIIWREFDIDFCADSLRLKFYKSGIIETLSTNPLPVIDGNPESLSREEIYD